MNIFSKFHPAIIVTLLYFLLSFAVASAQSDGPYGYIASTAVEPNQAHVVVYATNEVFSRGSWFLKLTDADDCSGGGYTAQWTYGVEFQESQVGPYQGFGMTITGAYGAKLCAKYRESIDGDRGPVRVIGPTLLDLRPELSGPVLRPHLNYEGSHLIILVSDPSGVKSFSIGEDTCNDLIHWEMTDLHGPSSHFWPGLADLKVRLLDPGANLACAIDRYGNQTQVLVDHDGWGY